MDWSEGYVTDIGYTRGYYRELSAAVQAFALAASGHEPPVLSRPFTKVELGCGYGVPLLMEAAVYPHARFYGVDFNPDHVTWAKRIAELAGLDNVQFFDISFSDMLASEIPDVDFAGLHGVWSWVSQANRDVIRGFLDKRLKSGGVVMASYNTMPGWSANRALRELMMRKFRSVAGPTAARIGEALTFALEMREAGAMIFRQYPTLSETLNGLTKMSKHYLAHEYFNQDWNLFYHHEVADAFAASRLAFLCSVKAIENYDHLNFPAPVVKLLGDLAPAERETARDVYRNRAFRYDLFGRGVERVGPAVTVDHVLQSRFILTDNPEKVAEGRIKTQVGVIKLKKELFQPILQRLSQGPAMGQEFANVPGARPLRPLDVMEVLALLMDANVVSLALPAADLDVRTQRTRRLNAALVARMMKAEDIGFLVSPVSGLGHQVPNFIQYFGLAESEGKDAIPFTWEALKQRGRRMQRDGVMLESEADNLAELERRHEEYLREIKPRLTSLGILGA